MAGMASIVVVDDDKPILEMTRDVLRVDGHAVRTFHDPVEALGYLCAPENALPDLLLLDIMMPSLSGHEVVSRLMADDRTRSLPIVVFTAKAQLEEAFAGTSAVRGFLVKPFGLERLRETVAKILAR